jgi:hypothetical protein
MGVNRISFFTQTLVIENVSEDIISIAFVGTAFTMMTKHNMKNLCFQNHEENSRIWELEEQFKKVKVDEGILKEFKASTNKIKE